MVLQAAARVAPGAAVPVARAAAADDADLRVRLADFASMILPL